MYRGFDRILAGLTVSFPFTWYRQFGHRSGSFGDAETLAKAMNTSVSGVVEAGVAESKGRGGC